MNFDELKARDVNDLRILAAKYGIKTHHRAKAETVAKQIVEFISNKPSENSLKHPAELPAKPPMVLHTEEEVRAALGTILEKQGFAARFLSDNTWLFQCRGAEESGHMSVPLRVIRSKAESVSNGARNPRGLKDNPLNPTSNSGLIMMI